MILSLFTKKKPASAAGAHNMDLNVRYPPLRLGVPFYTAEQCIDEHPDLINRIRIAVRFTPDEAQKYLMPLLYRTADYIHLLPGSQANHHRTAGGLIRHSLEVGYYAAHSATVSIFGEGKGENYQTLVKNRYLYCAFIGGLLHDLGKVFLDIEIRAEKSGDIWNPLRQNIQEWFATLKNEEKYHVVWRKRKDGLHEVFSLFGLERIVTEDDIAYITDNGKHMEIYESLILSLSNDIRTKELKDVILLRRLIKQADSRSRNRDNEGKMNVVGDEGQKIPIEDSIIAKLVHLLDLGVLNVNGPQATVINAEKIYLVWSDVVCTKIVEDCSNDGIAVPYSSKRVFDILHELAILKGQKGSKMGINISYPQEDGITKQLKVYELNHRIMNDYLEGSPKVKVNIKQVTQGTTAKPAVNGKPRNTKPERANESPLTSLENMPLIDELKPENRLNTDSIDTNNLLDIDFGEHERKEEQDNKTVKEKSTPTKERPKAKQQKRTASGNQTKTTAKKPTTEPASKQRNKPQQTLNLEASSEKENSEQQVNTETFEGHLSRLLKTTDLANMFTLETEATKYILYGEPNTIYKEIGKALNVKSYKIRHWIDDLLPSEQKGLNTIRIEVSR